MVRSCLTQCWSCTGCQPSNSLPPATNSPAHVPGAGDTRASAAVKALRKPTGAAWLANRLVHIAPDRIAELTEFGDDLHEAHRTGDRDRVKELTPRRYEMVGGLVDAAREDAATQGRRSVPPRRNVSGP